MKVLVCGATGCVGAAVAQSLRARGHRVVATVHHDSPGVALHDAIALDFMTPTSAERWAERLVALGIDAIVNAVGILMPSSSTTFERVHTAGPVELFRGAAFAGVERVVQVSALGVGDARHAEPAYLRSKRLADAALLALPIAGAVVRPSLVYGPRSQSARLFATLAALPVIALPGRGAQRVQPIHVFELAECIARLVERAVPARGVFELAGGDVVTYRGMLAAYRRALGLDEAIWLPMPMAAMRVGARVAEWLPQQVFCRDTVSLLERGNCSDRNDAAALLGRSPATFAESLAVTPPSAAVDLRVVLSTPVEHGMRAALAFLWLQTAIVSAALPQASGVLELLARCGFAGSGAAVALALSCALNAGLGVATILRPSARVYALQCAAIVGYTVTAAWHVPSLTIDHCGPLAKNATLLACVVALWLARSTARAARTDGGESRARLVGAARSRQPCGALPLGRDVVAERIDRGCRRRAALRHRVWARSAGRPTTRSSPCLPKPPGNSVPRH